MHNRSFQMLGSEATEPKNFDLLSEEDQNRYLQLRKEVSTLEARTSKFSFKSVLDKIVAFCMKNDSGDRLRYRVCGVCPTKNGLAISFKQLRYLLPVLKSTIHNSLQHMGYSTVKGTEENFAPLVEVLPELSNNTPELKSWTIYNFVSCTPISSLMTAPPTMQLSPEPTQDSVNETGPPSPQNSPLPTQQTMTEYFDDPFCLLPLFLV